jgi:hypothetical protein
MNPQLNAQLARVRTLELQGPAARTRSIRRVVLFRR